MKKFDIIRARTKDDAVVLIDRLMRAREDNVVLILPKSSIIAADLKSLKTLKEEAESVGKNLWLETENDDLRAFAKKIYLPIYEAESEPEFKPEDFKTVPINIPRKNGKIGTGLSRRDDSKKIMDIRPPFSGAKPKVMPKKTLERPMEESPMANYYREEPEPRQFDPEPQYQPAEEPAIYEVMKKSAPPEETGNKDLEKNIENFYRPADRTPIFSVRNFNIGKIFSYKALVNLLIIISGLTLMSTLYIVLQKATIKISVNEVPVKAEIPIAVSKNISLANLSGGIIPGQYFIFSKSGTRSLSSETAAPASVKSGGYINIYNSYSASPQRLVAQTRFETKDGKIFRIQEAVTVPGAKMENGVLTPSSIKAKVLSDLPGEEYNVGPAYFTIPGFKNSPKYAGFYAKSTESMVSEPVASKAFPSEELANLKNDLKAELVKQIESDTLSSLKDGDFKLIEGASTSKIDEFRTDSQNAFMKVTWQAIFFKEKDFRSVVSQYVVSHYADASSFVFQDAIAYPKVSKIDFKKGEMFLTFNLEKDNVFAVNIDELKKELAGHNKDEIRRIISDKKYMINSAAIYLTPFWTKAAPNNPDRINITLDK